MKLFNYLKDKVSPISRIMKQKSYLYRFWHGATYAFFDRSIMKPSYSQFGEDKVVFEYLFSNELLNKNWFYIDVGSNHPTTINDTFLFYQKGFKGICFEPNLELSLLHSIIRPKDTILNLAVGDGETRIIHFYETNNHVFSSTKKDDLVDTVKKTSVIPMVTLDFIFKQLELEIVFFLKIDTEGNDLSVLKGCKNSLSKVIIIQVETYHQDQKNQIVEFLGPNWKLIHSKLNSIFVNESIVKIIKNK